MEGIKELIDIIIRDQISSDDDPIRKDLGHVLQECCKLITDSESSVRSTLIGLLSSIVRYYPSSVLHPHLRLVVIYICSGMTHLRKDIRSHSLEFLDLFNSHLPNLICGFTKEFIPNYLYLLKLATQSINNNANTNTSNNVDDDNNTKKKSSNNMRLKIVSSLLRFLKNVFKYSEDIKNHNQYQDKTLENDNTIITTTTSIIDWKNNNKKINNISLTTDNNFIEQHNQMNNISIINILNTQNISKEARRLTIGLPKDANGDWWHSLQCEDHISELASQLTSLLIEYWMESLPSDYPNTNDNLIMMQNILEILSLVHQQCHSLQDYIRSGDMGCYTMLLKYVFVHFPFTGRTVRLSGERSAVDLSEKYNYSICLMAKRFITEKELSSNWVKRIIDYIIYSFENSSDTSIQPLLNIIERYYYIALNSLSSSSSSIDENLSETLNNNSLLWNSFTEYFMNLSPISPMKNICLSFINNIFKMKYSSFQNQKKFYVHDDDDNSNLNYNNIIDIDIEKKWLLSLPRLLFKLKGKNTNNMKEQILDILLNYGIHMNSIGLEAIKIFNEIQVLLVPFFYAKISDEKEYYGPFISSSLTVQQKTIFLLYYFKNISLSLLTSLVMCCKNYQKRISTEIIIQILEISYHQKDSLTVPEFISFLINIINSYSQSIHPNSNEIQKIQHEKDVDLIINQICLIFRLVSYSSYCVHIVGPSICFILNNKVFYFHL